MIHFAILVPGWRCADRVARCWASIAGQLGGGFTWEAHFYDDGSDDRTWQELAGLPADPRLWRYRGRANLGAAHARRELVRRVDDPDAVCVLLDMDDELEPGALARVALEYQGPAGAWLTYGSWGSDDPVGERRARAFRPYPPEVMAARAYRRHPFLATAPRTFRRHLADGLDPRYLQDPEGRWLMCATDVALTLALLERCPPARVRFIPEAIYRYTWKRPDGVAARFGAAYKARVRAHLAALPPLEVKADDGA